MNGNFRHPKSPTTPPVVIIAETDDDEDVIPGPSPGQSRRRVNGGSNSRSGRSSTKQLDMSLTEHHIKGDGILASLKDLKLPPEEFAAGCNLLQASARGDLSYLKECLKKSHVNFRDYDRRTALHVAASEGHLDVCKYLLDVAHAKMHRSDRWGGSPLDDARRHQHIEVERYLRKMGATPGSLHPATNLITASANGDYEEVRMIMAGVSSSKEKRRNIINEGDYDKRTALHLASGEGHSSIVRYLLEYGANANAEDRWNGRPMDDAIRHDRKECIQILEQFGGTPGIKDGPATTTKQETTSTHNDVFQDDPTMHVEFQELEMIERIGAGAFGEIYSCRWRGTLVAAKIVKSAKIRQEWLGKHAMNQMKSNEVEAEKLLDEAADVDQKNHDLALADFRQEIAVLKSLRHPNICLLLAYSTTEDYEVLVSELMKCNLLDIIKADLIHGRRMKHRTMIVYAQQLAQGMNYLHTCKPPIIHRDLKPANLLIDASGVLKVSDFGLAKIRPDPTNKTDGAYRMTGETGSYRFMAPEVYRCEDYDETVDIYSYAMILYTLLSGKPPWSDVNGLVAVQRACSENAERPWIPREWDSRLSSLLQQCWNEQRTRRPPFSKILVLLAEYSTSKFKSNPNQVTAEGLEPPKVGNEGRCCAPNSCSIL